MTQPKTPKPIFDTADLEKEMKLLQFSQREVDEYKYLRGKFDATQRLKSEVEKVIDELMRETKVKMDAIGLKKYPNNDYPVRMSELKKRLFGE